MKSIGITRLENRSDIESAARDASVRKDVLRIEVGGKSIYGTCVRPSKEGNIAVLVAQRLQSGQDPQVRIFESPIEATGLTVYGDLIMGRETVKDYDETDNRYNNAKMRLQGEGIWPL